MRHDKNEVHYCKECNKKILWGELPKWRKDQISSNGHTYCSKECSSEYQRKVSSITMAKTNRKYASERMKKNNPMKKEEVRKKVSETHKRNNHKPKIQGGNGRGLTIPQKLLSDVLDLPCEISVKTKKSRNSGYPSCYKIDIADEKNKIGIEVDGNSHKTLIGQKRDQKKTVFLQSKGWTILRFRNEMVLKNPEYCINKYKEALNEKTI